MCVSLILRLRINCHFSFLHLEKCFSGSVSQSQVREVCLLQLIDFTYFYFHGYNLLKGFLDGSDGKEFAYNVGDLGSIPRFERSPGGGNGNPLQYSSLENPHGQRSLAGYSPCGHQASDMTELVSTARHSGCAGVALYNLARDSVKFWEIW